MWISALICIMISIIVAVNLPSLTVGKVGSINSTTQVGPRELVSFSSPAWSLIVLLICLLGLFIIWYIGRGKKFSWIEN